jgi:hypothetical protein
MNDKWNPLNPSLERSSGSAYAPALIVIAVVLVALIGIVIWLADNDVTFSGGGAAHTAEQAHIVTPGTRTTASGHWACLSKDQYTQLLGLTSDREALEHSLTAAVDAKQCRLFNAGEKVYVIDVSWGDVLLQWLGEVEKWWTSGIAVN